MGTQAPVPASANIKCQVCQEMVSVRIPLPQLLAGPTFNMMLMVHENPDTCPKCGAQYAIKPAGLILSQTEQGPALVMPFTWALIPSGSQITPGNDQTLKSALAFNEMSTKMKEN